MKKKFIINQLKMDEIERLTDNEKKELVTKLNKKHGMTEREIGKMLNKPHSTIHDWISGRQDNTPGNLHISIDRVIEHFKRFKPEQQDFPKLNKLKEVIEQLLMQRQRYL